MLLLHLHVFCTNTQCDLSGTIYIYTQCTPTTTTTRRVVCCKLVGSAAASRQAAATAAGTAAQLQAAAAAEGLEVLEQILPDSVVELMALLTVQLERGGWGAAQELMLLAAATSVSCAPLFGTHPSS